MAASIFADKAIIPNESMVEAAVADTYLLWKELLSHMRANYPDISGEWKNYGKQVGWTYSLKSKKRTLCYFIPKDGYFSTGFVLGDRAVSVAEGSNLPSEIIESILSARHYVEGRSFAVEVNKAADLEAVRLLLKIKYEH